MLSSNRSSTRSGDRVAPAHERRRQRGQATVELALTLPFVAMALLLVVQVLLVAQGQLAVQHAAREAARAAAVDPDLAAATAAAVHGPLPAAGTWVTVEPPADGRVRVQVTHLPAHRRPPGRGPPARHRPPGRRHLPGGVDAPVTIGGASGLSTLFDS